jgi:arylsulfate sulfotransferase
MKNLLFSAWVVLVCFTASAQLPADFPTVTVTTNYAAGVGNGYIFEAVNLPAPGVGYYAMILGNDGTPLWYTPLTNACWDFKVLPNGYLHYAQQIRALSYTGGGDVIHQILDGNYYLTESIHGGNGYAAEAHDFKLLPNGNVLLVGYYLTRVDMSQVVTNGNPAALVSGAVLQELDAQRNVVWQWRAWDHYPFTSQWVNSTAAVISEFHINCLFLDNDSNLVVSTPNWVKKINRQTGDIMWHLGGTENQFTFVGVTQQQGVNDFNSHAINRLPNGDVLLYNNSAFGQPGSTSSVHEYSLDETNKIATHVWTYSPAPGVSGPFQGSAQRLDNGNTFIGWGGLPGVTKVACTEVSGTNVVFQMKFDNTNVISYRAFRFPYPTFSQAQVVQVKELASGNTYAFNGIGVSIAVQSGGGGYNQLTVSREQYAPVYPLFQGKAPLALPIRVSMSESALNALSGSVEFDAQSFQFANPTDLTVYYRQTTGQGLFLPQSTSYNPVTGTLSATVTLTSQGTDLGEFIFCYPDVADVPFPPILNEAENYPGVQISNVVAPNMATGGTTYSVNQQLPILLSWSPKGFARSYQFQISTNQDFSTTLVSMAYQNDAFFVWTDAVPNTLYYYRAITVNEGGQSDWSVGSFQTVPPSINLVSPNGGEALQRGRQYFIRWNDNISENALIQLYKGGVLAKTLATNAPSNGAFQWQIGFDLVPGADYSIRITSTADSGLSAQSAASFSIIDPPAITSGSPTRLPDGRVQFAIAVPGATQVSVLGSTNLSRWQLLQTLPLSNGNAVFTDNTATNLPALFYRLRVP